MRDLVGWVLVAGFVVFMIGAVGWRLEYDRPLAEALPVISGDRRRRAWIHLWMIAAMFTTSAGLAGFATIPDTRVAGVLAIMAAAGYALGALCWVVSLAFRLTVVPWAAERVAAGSMPDGFPAFDAWAGSLYVIHMAASYTMFAVIGVAVLESGNLPHWLGWLGLASGLGFLAGFVATRFAGPFNPPFLAHLYSGVLGVVLLTT